MKNTITILVLFFLAACVQKPSVDSRVWFNSNDISIKVKDGISYVSGEKFTGIIYSLYDNGDTVFVYPYNNGKLDGVVKVWYDNGQLQEERDYVVGRREGMQKGWYMDGTVKYIAGYKENMYHGQVQEWFPNGQLYRVFNYVNGQEEGMQKMYWNNGELRANYESKNGRKYGLTGIKNCATPWSDSLKRLFAGM